MYYSIVKLLPLIDQITGVTHPLIEEIGVNYVQLLEMISSTKQIALKLPPNQVLTRIQAP